MSTGDGDRRRPDRGFTFIEVVVVVALTTMFALVIERTLTSTHLNGRQLEATRRVTSRGQKVTYELHKTVSASRRLFQADATGLGYLAALDLAELPPTTESRLPIIDPVGELGPDEVGTPQVGNILLFVAEADPVPCISDADTGAVRYVDTYRFICVYPTQTDRNLVEGAPAALDLVLWRSVPYPCLTQITGIEDDDERQSVLRDLASRFGYDIAWDPAAAADQAFYIVDPLGNMAGAPDPDPEILPDPDASDWGLLVHGDVQLARTRQSSRTRRAVFSVENPVTEWAPDGLELKVAGPSGSRKVWLHLVIDSPATKGRTSVHSNTVIIGVRDL